MANSYAFLAKYPMQRLLSLPTYNILTYSPLKVDDLKEKLAAQEVELKQKNEDADLLIKKVYAI